MDSTAMSWRRSACPSCCGRASACHPCLSVVLRQFLISHQRRMPRVIALIIALAANVALNEPFLAGIGPFPAMGLAGIALATTIVCALLCAGLIAYIAMIQPFLDSRPFQRLWVMD